MVRGVLDRLGQGDARVLDFYAQCNEIWEEILRSDAADDVAALAQDLGSRQFEFEQACDRDRALGKEMMVVSGITRLYDPGPGWEGNEEIAQRVIDAIAQSNCSMEVKFEAERIADLYHLDPPDRDG